MSKEKARYFTFLLYPESIPSGWLDKLELIGVPIAVSPLHDKDLSDVEGQNIKSTLPCYLRFEKPCNRRKCTLEN